MRCKAIKCKVKVLESTINEWLDNNQNIKISAVAQTIVATAKTVVTTIFYEE